MRDSQTTACVHTNPCMSALLLTLVHAWYRVKHNITIHRSLSQASKYATCYCVWAPLPVPLPVRYVGICVSGIYYWVQPYNFSLSHQLLRRKHPIKLHSQQTRTLATQTQATKTSKQKQKHKNIDNHFCTPIWS